MVKRIIIVFLWIELNTDKALNKELNIVKYIVSNNASVITIITKNGNSSEDSMNNFV